MRTLVTLALVACTPATAARAPVASLAVPRWSHSASLLADGTILVAGGMRKGADGVSQLYTDTSEIVDPRTDTVVAGPRLGHARGGHVAVTLGDGSVLVAGGWDGGGRLRTAELFNPARRAFRPVGDLVEPRAGATATRLADGRVVVIGGGDDVRSLASIEIFEPATQRWRRAGSLATPRAGHTATLLRDGRVLVVGGLAEPGRVVASAELYDPARERTAPAGELAAPRYKHAASLLATGEVMVIAGSDARDWTGKSDTTEIYDPATGRFRPGPALRVPRFKLPQAVVTLSGGDLAIAGGAPTIERVHGGASRTIATLDGGSYYGTATLVPSGELVVIGGYDDRIHTSASVWRLRP